MKEKLTVHGEYVGGIIGESYNTKEITIEKCYNTGKVSNTGGHTAGIIGRMAKTTNIIECYNTGEITGSTGIGGIGGQYEDQIENGLKIQKCYNTGRIGDNELASYKGGCKGGIAGNIGSIKTTVVEKCYNKGKVSSSEDSIGGIVGYGSKGSVLFCYNQGDITGKINVGGIVGYFSEGKVENAYNLGNVIGYNKNTYGSVNVGGIAGNILNVKNVYNLGEVNGECVASGETKINAGGIVGYLSSTYSNSKTMPGTIENAYNLNNIKYKNEVTQRNIGAIVGYGYPPTELDLSTTYYLKGTCGTNIGTGEYSSQIKETEAEMKNIMNSNLANLEGWQKVTDGYPIFDF